MTDLEHIEPVAQQVLPSRDASDAGGRRWVWTGDAAAVAVLVIAALITVYSHRLTERHVERAWIFASVAALILLGRGIRLRRPFTARHVGLAAVGLVVAIAADATHFGLIGFVATVLVGFALVLPAPSRPDPAMLHFIIPLVDETPDDPLAPFVLHSRKSYFLNAAGTAAVGYRTRFGIAVVGGDPVGDTSAFASLIGEFTAFCRGNGWRVAVLGAGERCRDLWADRSGGGPGLRSVAFGREVVLDVQNFHLNGRQFRNLRQAVNRSHNAGVTTEVLAEADIDEPLRRELLAVADAVDRGDQRRGFSMILDRLLTGEIPGLWLVIARDRKGAVAGFQRYGTADGGREVSLDVPCRRPDAPNGTDERMAVDMVAWARQRGAVHLSLSFAAFPELFDDAARGRVRQALYRLVHLGDGLLELESLYTFLRKFHGLGQHRYVLFKRRAFIPSLAAMLSLEFGPHRRRRG
ncbi:Lysylphosphatidylglycerol synthetase, C-terminal domain, DUF2156 family [Nakamurella panacisegetis]|uniref:Lysylphosphatidylglycerol synthetase, C-terminal domain, DUF2156 family n=1 Tax=Nakamurella panacisegetis TaxID=1090615 RepID=A0A1H0MGB2_9ACTN|nr:phosphatidylglycerol lysyltransferase domain-containing protein [Nakamurella panacisegetis]SDO79459.1 Lysylphosphatidylglycerol synthetase, C-terminal domain, DUF2156 family [Nakamurella panacisegetis]